ncbi:uncharacterized protein LOC123557844 [Mercenaria mercenaria]|uniref:uncharacterized protein LOC123557844 n=1 Tax=Mercenaria mercenaria TaxID=6596 RepID=UPI00234E8837|nr:uncharacterized protein LOC123557844 [Mercenaria mercenaria]
MAEKLKNYKNLTHEQKVKAEQEFMSKVKKTLKVDNDKLTASKARRNSARDERKSAANIGYVGIGMLALVFGTVFIMDLGALKRDALILMANLKDGFGRLHDCTVKRFRKKRRQPFGLTYQSTQMPYYDFPACDGGGRLQVAFPPSIIKDIGEHLARTNDLNGFLYIQSECRGHYTVISTQWREHNSVTSPHSAIDDSVTIPHSAVNITIRARTAVDGKGQNSIQTDISCTAISEEKAQLIAAVLFGVVLHKALGVNTTYVVALLGQDLQNGSSSAKIEYQLVIVNEESTDIRVEIRDISGLIEELDVNISSTAIYTVDQKMGMNGSEFSNKSLLVHSENGKFVLQVFTKRNDYVEGLLAIPVQRMTGPNQNASTPIYDHVVATFCAVGGYCQIAIAAAENNTEVFIDIPTNVEEIAFCNQSSYYRSKFDKRITMNQFDALQLETTFDLTGTVIFSYKPIAVFVGSRNVTNGNITAHTMEQLVPTSHWGKEFVVQNLGSNGYGDILKIVSHFSSTTVTMSGFPAFNITERYHTVTRRLDKGMRSHIQASHPIQVIQITGLTYATDGETSALSMTVVPSIQNALQKFTVACQEDTPAQFHIVTEKDSCLETSAAGEKYPKNSKNYGCEKPVYESRMKYTKFMIGTINVNIKEHVVDVTNDKSDVSGILKCGQTATMPIGVFYNKDVTGTIPASIPEYQGGTCYEGGKARTQFFPKSTTAGPYILDLTDYAEHVLKLRVQVCGSADLRFMNSDNVIDVMLSYEGIRIASCSPDCEYQNTTNFTNDSFNAEAGKDCTSDMSFFWFWHTGSTFCLGTGYKHQKDKCEKEADNTDNTNNIVRINIENPFDKVSMIGTFANASFNWDLIHVDGCKEYDSGWRCADKFVNCSQYDEGFCTDQKNSGFASFYCAKFCGKCFPDSYGKKFILRIPDKLFGSSFAACRIVVSPLNKLTNVAVYSDSYMKTGNVRHGTRYYKTGERSFDCTDSDTKYVATYTILSDDDVAVIVLIQLDGKIQSCRGYPVDTYGTEFMVVEYGKKESKQCTFLSEHDDVSYVAYYSMNSVHGEVDSANVILGPLSRLQAQNKNDMSGTEFVFNKPSAVFCGDLFPKAVGNQYNQLLPTNTWSTEYVVPAFDVEAVNRLFDGKLFIVSNADNTIVNISGGFDAIHAIYNRGDKIEQEIDVGAAYKIKSSENIGVGLYLYDPADPTKASFNMLVPARSFHDTVLTFVPNNVLKCIDFDVTEIKTYFVNRNLNSTIVSKEADDTDPFYRHVSIDSSVYEMTVVQSGTEKWFVVPGNVKSAVIQNPKENLCHISAASQNDGKDNDCDGLIDEDGYYGDKYGVYKQDHDLDGGFGEDYGGDLVSNLAVVQTPKEPECIEIKKVEGQCWKACRCSCSMAEKLKNYKNLTHEQKVKAEQEFMSKVKKTLKVDNDKLTAAKARRNSARDERKSAANIGYVGIGMFALVFGAVFIMDLGALKRDALILMANLKDGFGRLHDCTVKRFRKKKRQPINNTNVE